MSENKEKEGSAGPPKLKQKYDWYQTDSTVVITLLIKNSKKEDVQVDYTERAVSATIKQPSGNDFSLELDLAHNVVPAKCTTKIMSMKIELKLVKEEGLRWNKLEGEDTLATNAATEQDAQDIVHKYPTSSHVTRNWDKIGKEAEEEEKEKAEGEAALNQLFQKIYGDASDDVKKAMNKSFTESGGTVLSTNWKEIGPQKTEIKPPDGMEYKKWDT
ncbi:protein SGT1 homolog [Patiria miniata]|uniref:Suppressor of G2 allele of SKP1 n=1 Tax=Patiria miniata TaxID=46514 RepID=A0A913ZWZ3_PATMI|nr:protein SGT1 homolog [Patiria miniata]